MGEGGLNLGAGVAVRVKGRGGEVSESRSELWERKELCMLADLHADGASPRSWLPRHLAVVGTSSMVSSSWGRGPLTL